MNSFCSYFNLGLCKSCDFITMPYPDQLRAKEDLLQKSLIKLRHPPLLSTVASTPTAFRNKAKLVVTGTLENPIIGLWGEKDLDQGRELLNCPLHVPELNELLPAIKEFIIEAKLTPYQIAAKSGELKGVILFHSQESRETYLRFILRSKESIDRIRKKHHILLEKFAHLKCISVNLQPVPHAILEGEEEIFITDNQSILHQLGTTTFLLGPRAFVQTNQRVATQLYQTAASWVQASGLKKFMELYCGQGAFSFFAAPYIEEALGIEINEEAVKEANRTADKFNLSHLRFKSADAGKVSSEVSAFAPSILLVNPPRRGLAEAVEVLKSNRPEMIIYSSCNYETLSLDLSKLSDLYEIKKIQLFDMFPNTSHFETLVQLNLK